MERVRPAEITGPRRGDGAAERPSTGGSRLAQAVLGFAGCAAGLVLLSLLLSP